MKERMQQGKKQRKMRMKGRKIEKYTESHKETHNGPPIMHGLQEACG
jgi:hypothetical protein